MPLLPNRSIELHSEGELTLRIAATVTSALGERVWRIGGRRIGVAGIETSPLLSYGDVVQCALRLPSSVGRLDF